MRILSNLRTLNVEMILCLSQMGIQQQRYVFIQSQSLAKKYSMACYGFSCTCKAHQECIIHRTLQGYKHKTIRISFFYKENELQF